MGAAAEVVHHAVELVVELDDLVHRVLDVVEEGILLPHALHQFLDLTAADLSGHVPEQCTLEQKTGRVALLDERRVDAADPGSTLRENIDQPVALQSGQCFVHRCTAHSEGMCELDLIERLPRLQPECHDVRTQHAGSVGTVVFVFMWRRNDQVHVNGSFHGIRHN